MKEEQTKKILIIDDEEDIVYTIREICEFSGYTVIAAGNGAEGYQMFMREKPNLIIVDYHMPGWDGLKTVKAISEENTGVAILVLTVDERQEISDKFMSNGATDFAIKPIKAPDLIARIRVNLRINEMQEALIQKRENIFVEKGISPATLSIIKDFLNQQTQGVTIEEVTKGVDLAYQTVHRYIQYLVESELLEPVPQYGQKGRPKNIYQLKNKIQE